MARHRALASAPLRRREAEETGSGCRSRRAFCTPTSASSDSASTLSTGPDVVHTPTVIFNAKEAETDAAATWRPYFKGPFTVHETPDPHLDEASVEAARQVILRHLRDLGDA